MLNAFFKTYDRYMLIALLPIIAVPFVLDKLFSLQPPWPNGSNYITAFLELAIIFVAFFADIRSQKALRKRQRIALLAAVVMFFGYFVLYSLFVFVEPISGRSIVGGFQCTEEARRYVAPLLHQTCPFLDERALSAAAYQPDRLWTPLSIKLIEFATFACWSGFFMVATYLFAVTLAFASRKKMLG